MAKYAVRPAASAARSSSALRIDTTGSPWRVASGEAAEEYGATGWVRNEADESVSMELQGTEKQIRSVLGAIKGNSYIRIDRVESKPLAVIKNERGFEVKF